MVEKGGGRAASLEPAAALNEIRERMTRFAAHMRSRKGAQSALDAALAQYATIRGEGLKIASAKNLVDAVGVEQQCLTQVALLKAIVEMFERGAGSRGSHCILDESGIEMHPRLGDPETGKPYRFLQENKSLRETLLCLRYDEAASGLFEARDVAVRPIPDRDIAFEPAWREYREGRIYEV